MEIENDSNETQKFQSVIGVRIRISQKMQIFCKIRKEYKITPMRDKNFKVRLE